MRIEDILKSQVKDAVKALYDHQLDTNTVQIQETRKEFEGDLTVVVFPLVKLAKKGPEQCGTELGQHLVDNSDHFTNFNVVKGFLNISVSDAYWKEFFAIAKEKEDYGHSPANSKEQVMVEFSSPNTNKPLHLGHLRNIFLGNSVSQILKANGHDVLKVQIINDRGIHICKSMVAWQEFGNGATPESAGMKGDKFVGHYYVQFDKQYKAEVAELKNGGMDEKEAEKQAPILLKAQETLRKWEAKDPETYNLWETMNGWVYSGFDTTYETMEVTFDKLYYESNTYLKGKEEVEKGLEQGVFYKKEDGSVWVDLEPDGLDQKLVLRADGTAVYMTQDIGTAILRFQDYPNLAFQVYTVGNEQEYHFKVLFLILKKLGFDKAGQNYHLSYGMVELPEGKMKSREGTVVDADDLMEEMVQNAQQISEEQGKLADLNDEEKRDAFKMIGHGALKYFLLKVDPKKGMKFDPKESIDFLGNTGPFIQFNYVRTRSLLRKNEGTLEYGSEVKLGTPEKQLIKLLHQYPEAIEESARTFDPSHLASYSYQLAKEFSSFYQQCPILSEENESLKLFRLSLAKKAGDVIRSSMNLLGIR
ncbi:MAG: arginine--tRNA ligase, partial [Flavobacteriales bacterium]|nr:arginine--tRNA ligase [Flavobacteriales bacterium]